MTVPFGIETIPEPGHCSKPDREMPSKHHRGPTQILRPNGNGTSAQAAVAHTDLPPATTSPLLVALGAVTLMLLPIPQIRWIALISHPT